MKKVLLLIIVSLQFSFIASAQGFTSKTDSINYMERRKQILLEMAKPNPERDRREKEISKERVEKEFKNAEERMKTAEFAFEGTLIKYESYPYNDPNGHKEKRVSLIYNITKVFKGNLKLGTIELILGDEERELIDIPAERNRLKLSDNINGIVFARKATEFPYNPLYNIDKVDNNTILTIYPENFSFSMNNLNGKWTGNQKEFPTKDSLYNYLRKFEGLNIPSKAEKWQKKEEITAAAPTNIKPRKTVKQINEELLRLKKKPKNAEKANKLSIKAAALEAGFTYSFSNYSTTYSGTKVYFEYDVNISASSPVYLVHSFFYIEVV